MKTPGLLSLLALLVLPGFTAAQDSQTVPPPPSAEEPTDAAAEVPELLPPGKTGSTPGEKSRIRVYQPAQLPAPISAPVPAQIPEQIPVQIPPQIRLPAHPVSVVDAVVLTHNRVSDEVLVQLVRQYGSERPLTPNDLVTLHNEGVSQAVMLAMQQCPAPVVSTPPPVRLPQPFLPPPISARPLIIQEYRYLAPPPVRFYYPAPYRPHHGPHWGVSIYGH
ncbi:MAG: hypothetical protein NTY19_28000 [Planctomycetota bacterium]|nr:hypothetical protein [Planctomycetota bacterium]